MGRWARDAAEPPQEMGEQQAGHGAARVAVGSACWLWALCGGGEGVCAKEAWLAVRCSSGVRQWRAAAWGRLHVRVPAARRRKQQRSRDPLPSTSPPSPSNAFPFSLHALPPRSFRLPPAVAGGSSATASVVAEAGAEAGARRSAEGGRRCAGARDQEDPADGQLPQDALLAEQGRRAAQDEVLSSAPGLMF